MLEICLIKALIVAMGGGGNLGINKSQKNVLAETKSTCITVNPFTEAQQRTSTFHSSQLTPIHPGAF